MARVEYAVAIDRATQVMKGSFGVMDTPPLDGNKPGGASVNPCLQI
jgi:hypothetical protein